MKRHVVQRSPRPVIFSPKTQPLLAAETVGTPRTTVGKGGREEKRRTTGKRFGEVAGGTAAECAAVCCCCPCALMNVLVLAVIKVPACLCRKAKKRRLLRRKMKKQLPQQQQQQQQQALLGPTDSGRSRLELEREVREVVERGNAGINGDDKATVDLEKEMWDRFYGAGFWRSPSQRAAA